VSFTPGPSTFSTKHTMLDTSLRLFAVCCGYPLMSFTMLWLSCSVLWLSFLVSCAVLRCPAIISLTRQHCHCTSAKCLLSLQLTPISGGHSPIHYLGRWLGETDISLTNQLADSQFADKTTRWQTKSLTILLADSQLADKTTRWQTN